MRNKKIKKNTRVFILKTLLSKLEKKVKYREFRFEVQRLKAKVASRFTLHRFVKKQLKCGNFCTLVAFQLKYVVGCSFLTRCTWGVNALQKQFFNHNIKNKKSQDCCLCFFIL